MFSDCKRKISRLQITTMERNPTTTIRHKKKQFPNLVIYNAVVHKMQLGIALTTKLLHFLQEKWRCDNTQYAAQ